MLKNFHRLFGNMEKVPLYLYNITKIQDYKLSKKYLKSTKMNTMRIMAGIITGAEFFTNDTGTQRKPMCMDHGVRLNFEDIPAEYKNLLYAAMISNPIAEAAMIAMVGDNKEAALERFAMCQYGLADGNPDIDDDGNLSAPEYVPCPERGTCKHEGKGCCSIMFSDAIFLSSAETRIFKLIMLSNEEIADELCISKHTVGTHIQNMLVKTGFKNKLELLRWGTIRNII